jgi:hypothetical protein
VTAALRLCAVVKYLRTGHSHPPCKARCSKRVGDSGFEPLTSSASKKYDSLLKVSGACKIPANRYISTLAHFLTFQEIHSSCCTVAAHP